MSAIYETFGPFKLKREGAKLSESAQSDLWQSLSSERPGLCDAVGVYIITVRAQKGHGGKPWYVGRTDRLGFQRRLSQHELRFRQVLEKARNGVPELLLIALKTRGRDAFRKRKRTKGEIRSNEWLESAVIGSALSQNPDLINASKTKHFKTMIVPGFINSRRGKLTSSASALKRTLGAK